MNGTFGPIWDRNPTCMSQCRLSNSCTVLLVTAHISEPVRLVYNGLVWFIRV